MQKGIVGYLQNGQVELGKEDLFVNITLYHVPASLVKEFALRYAYKYPGGMMMTFTQQLQKALKKVKS